MRNQSLVKDYIKRSGNRLAAVQLLYDRKSYADVVRESQEIAELCLKALLRHGGLKIPRIHDVGEIILSNPDRFTGLSKNNLEKLAEYSHELRRDRELAFYGTEDLTPGEFYKQKHAKKALEQAQFVHQLVSEHCKK